MIKKVTTQYEFKRIAVMHVQQGVNHDVTLGFTDQSWKSDLPTALELAAAVMDLEQTVHPKHPPTLNAASDPAPRGMDPREVHRQNQEDNRAEEPLRAAYEQLVSEGRKLRERASEKDRRVTAQAPDPKDGEVLVQLTTERFSELLNLSNGLIQDGAMIERDVSLPGAPMRGLQLARLVAEVFGGRKAST